MISNSKHYLYLVFLSYIRKVVNAAFSWGVVCFIFSDSKKSGDLFVGVDAKDKSDKETQLGFELKDVHVRGILKIKVCFYYELRFALYVKQNIDFRFWFLNHQKAYLSKIVSIRSDHMKPHNARHIFLTYVNVLWLSHTRCIICKPYPIWKT